MNLTTQQLTQLLNRASDSPDSVNDLYDRVYQELHQIAARYMARESAGHTLQVTGLVHEAYLELFIDDERTWESRAHFFGYAATVMRHILVRHAKRKRADKRGGDSVRTTLDGLQTPGSDPVDLIALDDALTRLAKWDQRKARLIELRFLAGLSIEETALAAGLSQATVYNDLKIAKGWLVHALSGQA